MAVKTLLAHHLRSRLRTACLPEKALVLFQASIGTRKYIGGKLWFHIKQFRYRMPEIQSIYTEFLMRPHNISKRLFSPEQIRTRIHSLIDEIAEQNDPENLVMLGILRGSFIFLADLVRGFEQHRIHPRIDFITLSSYGSGTESSGTVEISHDTDEDLTGADVVVVDDILDSGRTLAFAKDLFLRRGARSVRTCVLLDKQTDRAAKIDADYTGFPVEDVFVVGYGLDYDNRYRELPYIAEVTFTDS